MSNGGCFLACQATDVMYEETEFTDDCESISRFGQACMVESGQELFRANVKGIGKKKCLLVDHPYEYPHSNHHVI